MFKKFVKNQIFGKFQIIEKFEKLRKLGRNKKLRNSLKIGKFCGIFGKNRKILENRNKSKNS